MPRSDATSSARFPFPGKRNHPSPLISPRSERRDSLRSIPASIVSNPRSESHHIHRPLSTAQKIRPCPSPLLRPLLPALAPSRLPRPGPGPDLPPRPAHHHPPPRLRHLVARASARRANPCPRRRRGRLWGRGHWGRCPAGRCAGWRGWRLTRGPWRCFPGVVIMVG